MGLFNVGKSMKEKYEKNKGEKMESIFATLGQFFETVMTTVNSKFKKAVRSLSFHLISNFTLEI